MNRCGRLTIEKKIKKSFVKCKCDCGKEVEVLHKDFVAKKHASCGCVKNTELEDRIIKWLEQHEIPYIFDYDVTLFNGAMFTFDMLIPKDNGYIIRYDQYRAFDNDRYGSAMEIRKKEASVIAHIQLIGNNFGIPVLILKYEDLDDVEKKLEEFFDVK